jgi:hypothetical protein
MSSFYECQNVPPCQLGVGGLPKVAAEYAGPAMFTCKSNAHDWHPHGPLVWYGRGLNALCSDHRCEQLHAAGEPKPAPPPTVFGSGQGESAEQAALRERFELQESA